MREILITKQEFINDLKTAIDENKGYAAAKIGFSQKHWLYYPLFLKTEVAQNNPKAIKFFESKLLFHGLKQSGIFPATTEFYLEYNEFYVSFLKKIDCLGLFLDSIAMEKAIVQDYSLKNKLIYYLDQEPDRSIPSNRQNCYLQYLRGKKVLIICPFAELLSQRADQLIFEGVWSRTGKQWFFPERVDSLEFPYGFSGETHQQYSNAIELFEHIKAKIQEKDFDVALIGAAGLAIPIAAFIKSLGKVSIDLGGHLQVLFGVIGQRWRNREDWRQKYFNEWWIDMPAQYIPQEGDVCDKGAYW